MKYQLVCMLPRWMPRIMHLHPSAFERMKMAPRQWYDCDSSGGDTGVYAQQPWEVYVYQWCIGTRSRGEKCVYDYAWVYRYPYRQCV